MYKIINFIRMVYRGKTLRRIQFNSKLEIWSRDFYGSILDLGAGSKDSLKKFLPEGSTVISTDISDKEGVMGVDLNKPLPFEVGSMDVVTLFFVLYILDSQEATLKEIYRILKPGGKLYIATPLIAAEIREPHDYCRLTYEGLERLFQESGFKKFTVERSGGRASSAAVLLHPLFFFNTVRLLIFALCLGIDHILRNKDIHNPVPHTYFCVLEK